MRVCARYAIYTLGLLFELRIAHAQRTATVSGPSLVKAGETLTVVINLDRAPNFPGCVLAVSAQSDSSAFNAGSNPITLDTKETRFTATVSIPIAAPGGTYHAHAMFVCDGILGWQRLGGSEVSFQVIPTKGLILPTSATVGITESQGQILRKEALRLQAAMQDLKGRIREVGDAPRLITVLTNSILERQSALQNTEKEFAVAARDVRQHQDAQVFFEDIRAQYEEALTSLGRTRNHTPHKFAFLPSAFDSKPQPASSLYPALAQGTLRVLEHNELAYTTVADTNSLTFDLEVGSSPPNAQVFYKRHGDDFKSARTKLIQRSNR